MFRGVSCVALVLLPHQLPEALSTALLHTPLHHITSLHSSPHLGARVDDRLGVVLAPLRLGVLQGLLEVERRARHRLQQCLVLCCSCVCVCCVVCCVCCGVSICVVAGGLLLCGAKQYFDRLVVSSAAPEHTVQAHTLSTTPPPPLHTQRTCGSTNTASSAACARPPPRRAAVSMNSTSLPSCMASWMRHFWKLRTSVQHASSTCVW